MEKIRVLNTMISGYGKFGFLEKARKMFDEMRDRDNFSWTAMISGYVRYDKPLEALELYRSMQISEKSISNKFTVSSALAAASAISKRDSWLYNPNWVGFR